VAAIPDSVALRPPEPSRPRLPRAAQLVLFACLVAAVLLAAVFVGRALGR
jgi:hypothetical protein